MRVRPEDEGKPHGAGMRGRTLTANRAASQASREFARTRAVVIRPPDAEYRRTDRRGCRATRPASGAARPARIEATCTVARTSISACSTDSRPPGGGRTSCCAIMSEGSLDGHEPAVSTRTRSSIKRRLAEKSISMRRTNERPNPRPHGTVASWSTPASRRQSVRPRSKIAQVIGVIDDPGEIRILVIDSQVEHVSAAVETAREHRVRRVALPVLHDAAPFPAPVSAAGNRRCACMVSPRNNRVTMRREPMWHEPMLEDSCEASCAGCTPLIAPRSRRDAAGAVPGYAHRGNQTPRMPPSAGMQRKPCGT